MSPTHSGYYSPFCADSNCPASRGAPTDGSTHCQAIAKLTSVLIDTFGHSQFRAGQLDAAVAVLHGQDVFVRMSTGAGKSVCFYLPLLYLALVWE